MGNQTGNGGAIAYIPASGNRPAETIAAVRATRGGNIREALAQRAGGTLPARARILNLSAEDLANYGGPRRFASEADINDILGAGRTGRRLVQTESRGARANIPNPARAETRAAQNSRNAARNIERRQAELRTAQNERRRITRSTMGQRRKAAALRENANNIAALRAEIARQRGRG